MFVFISQKNVQLSTWAYEHVLQRSQCDCLLCQFPVWEVILNIKVIASVWGPPLLYSMISLASLIYLRFYLCIYPYSEVISSIMYEASDSRPLDKSFVVLVLKAFFNQPWSRKSGTSQQSSFIRRPPGGGVGSEILDSHGLLLLFSFLQSRLLSLSQVK